MITIYLLISLGVFLIYHKVQKLSAATGRLATLNEGMSQAVNTQNGKLDALSSKLATV